VAEIKYNYWYTPAGTVFDHEVETWSVDQSWL